MVDSIAVLASGGLDSCVLIADLAEDAKVSPLYVRKGLAWEDAELTALVSFIEALGNPNANLMMCL